jgi:hypothetical protein
MKTYGAWMHRFTGIFLTLTLDGQFHALAVLSTGKEPSVPVGRGDDWAPEPI